jgi:hypothetical protein
MRPVLIFKIACSISLGIDKFEANPLPEPTGIMPKEISLPTICVATSCIVPSPPHATTISAPASIADSVKEIACFLYFEKATFKSYSFS